MQRGLPRRGLNIARQRLSDSSILRQAAGTPGSRPRDFQSAAPGTNRMEIEFTQ